MWWKWVFCNRNWERRQEIQPDGLPYEVTLRTRETLADGLRHGHDVPGWLPLCADMDDEGEEIIDADELPVFHVVTLLVRTVPNQEGLSAEELSSGPYLEGWDGTLGGTSATAEVLGVSGMYHEAGAAIQDVTQRFLHTGDGVARWGRRVSWHPGDEGEDLLLTATGTPLPMITLDHDIQIRDARGRVALTIARDPSDGHITRFRSDPGRRWGLDHLSIIDEALDRVYRGHGEESAEIRPSDVIGRVQAAATMLTDEVQPTTLRDLDLDVATTHEREPARETPARSGWWGGGS